MAGDVGDKAFRNWLSVELDLPLERREECLSRAKTFSILSNPSKWEEFGGYRQLRHVVSLNKRERAAVLGTAKASGYRISTVVRQRSSEERRSVPLPPSDVVLLAEFIESLDRVPENIREIARRHVRAKNLWTIRTVGSSGHLVA